MIVHWFLSRPLAQVLCCCVSQNKIHVSQCLNKDFGVLLIWPWSFVKESLPISVQHSEAVRKLPTLVAQRSVTLCCQVCTKREDPRRRWSCPHSQPVQEGQDGGQFTLALRRIHNPRSDDLRYFGKSQQEDGESPGRSRSTKGITKSGLESGEDSGFQIANEGQLSETEEETERSATSQGVGFPSKSTSSRRTSQTLKRGSKVKKETGKEFEAFASLDHVIRRNQMSVIQLTVIKMMRMILIQSSTIFMKDMDEAIGPTPGYQHTHQSSNIPVNELPLTHMPGGGHPGIFGSRRDHVKTIWLPDVHMLYWNTMMLTMQWSTWRLKTSLTPLITEVSSPPLMMLSAITKRKRRTLPLTQSLVIMCQPTTICELYVWITKEVAAKPFTHSSIRIS